MEREFLFEWTSRDRERDKEKERETEGETDRQRRREWKSRGERESSLSSSYNVCVALIPPYRDMTPVCMDDDEPGGKTGCRKERKRRAVHGRVYSRTTRVCRHDTALSSHDRSRANGREAETQRKLRIREDPKTVIRRINAVSPGDD